MRRVLLAVLSALVVFGPLSVVRATDADVKAILDKAIKAHGGEEALSKYQATRAVNKGKLTLPGLGEVEFTQEMALMHPNKLREKLDFEIMNTKITVTTLVNGDKVSIEANGKEVPVTDNIKKALENARHLMRVAHLVGLTADKNLELSSAGEVKVEGKPVVGVLVKSKDGKDVLLFFDKESGLLVKMEHRTVEPMTGQDITEERIILEYSKPGPEGIPTPKKVLVKRDGEKFLEAEVSESKLLEKLDDSEFTKP